ncbi:uncharacterized protein N0V89_006154 [Didymosphaeria variabile]|uniref:Uncharacterized protein n=1 Tax=Didymosphaeria variabile TaxID=1932322 RepID=A0A9W8XNI9_9PLEO|nr:uncharacterized protein N0V89_006154 [Didymosphaeria variabile]KAJ4354418.1 hypothetical protein N0V89_006154 [Didymosphaeria variabile]
MVRSLETVALDLQLLWEAHTRPNHLIELHRDIYHWDTFVSITEKQQQIARLSYERVLEEVQIERRHEEATPPAEDVAKEDVEQERRRSGNAGDIAVGPSENSPNMEHAFAVTSTHDHGMVGGGTGSESEDTPRSSVIDHQELCKKRPSEELTGNDIDTIFIKKPMKRKNSEAKSEPYISNSDDGLDDDEIMGSVSRMDICTTLRWRRRPKKLIIQRYMLTFTLPMNPSSTS